MMYTNRLIAKSGMVVTLCLVLAACDESPKKVIPSELTMNTTETFASGLKKEILKAAPVDAASPKKGQQVTVHYTGWLDENGKQGAQFDSSIGRGPFTFVIGTGSVIKGWDEGVMTMKIGEKARLIIPSHLGYGAYGAADVIPPHATLIFDVELLGVK